MLEYAQALASLTALVGIWINERRNGRPGSADEFREWLADHKFGDLVEHLEAQAGLFDQLAEIVDLRADELMVKLNEIQEMQIRVFDRLDPPEPPAQAISLSDQAVSLMAQLYASGKAELMDIRMMRGRQLTASGGPKIEVAEMDHLTEDLEALCHADLLKDRPSSDGRSMFYTITRNGKARAQEWYEDQQ